MSGGAKIVMLSPDDPKSTGAKSLRCQIWLEISRYITVFVFHAA